MLAQAHSDASYILQKRNDPLSLIIVSLEYMKSKNECKSQGHHVLCFAFLLSTCRSEIPKRINVNLVVGLQGNLSRAAHRIVIMRQDDDGGATYFGNSVFKLRVYYKY